MENSETGKEVKEIKYFWRDCNFIDYFRESFERVFYIYTRFMQVNQGREYDIFEGHPSSAHVGLANPTGMTVWIAKSTPSMKDAF